jgi:hypothetical protein
VVSSRSEYFDAGLVVALQQPEQLAGDDAAQTPLGVPAALALGGAPGNIGAGVGIGAEAYQQDGVQRPVELPVAAAVDSLGELWCQADAWLMLTLLGGASRLMMGKVASCPASRCDLPCALSAL